jgi:F-type H+-transporting ATPase subunit alpha
MNAPKPKPSGSLLQAQRAWLDAYQLGLRVTERGSVVSVGDGIAWISGLPSAAIDDILRFEDGSLGMVFDLSRERVGAILLHETETLTAGNSVLLTGQPLSIGAGDSLLGRIVDPLGRPLDGQTPPLQTRMRVLENASPPIVARDFVQRPLYTGNKIIDTLIPIGKGQRQLIIGDEGLGRSSLAIDTVINQRGRDVICIYALIGQKRSTVVNTIALLREYGALPYTVVVVAEAGALPGLQYISPFSACTLAQYWMEQGRDTLVVYDDLSTHANTYRELSLLLRRPPGREAYPGDVFYVHARLLECSTCLNAKHGGGSMTALPIVETKQGEIAAYIPTNLISITDGQIYLDKDLFASGFLPAIDIALSVSRIGGKAQHRRIRDEAGRMKLDYLQFLELEVFTRFGARLEASMEAKIRRGRLLRELLKQERLTPLAEKFQFAWLIAFNDGLFDAGDPDNIAAPLAALADAAANSPLTLDSGRSEWAQAVRDWLQIGGEANA